MIFLISTSCSTSFIFSHNLKIRKMNDKENSRIGANSFSGGATGGIGYGATQVGANMSSIKTIFFRIKNKSAFIVAASRRDQSIY